MRVYRATRRYRTDFDPLDSSASVARSGWRYNDRRTEILYAASVESLAILEVVARPGWNTVAEITVAAIEIPDRTVVELGELSILLPTNWNMRPAAPNAQRISAEFLTAVDHVHASTGRRVCGVRVPSVISTTDMNVLLDPRQRHDFSVAGWSCIPFDWLVGAST